MTTLLSVRTGRVTRNAASLAAALAVLLGAAAAAAADRSDEHKRITDSAGVVQTLVRAPDQGIPDYILDRAEAIVVIPSLVKGGFIVGAQHGKGVISVR